MNRSATDLAENRYFQIHGLDAVAPEALNEALKTAIRELEVGLYGPSRSELTDGEVAMLERAGVDLDDDPSARDPMMEYATEFAAILATSMTPTELAKRLELSPVRIRQMIRDHSIFAIRVEGRWHVPIYQIEKGVLVPNVAKVNQALSGLDPVSVQRWFTSLDPGLEDANGELMTPLAWLKSGRDVGVILPLVPE